MRRLLLLLVLAAGAFAGEVDVYILAGQSNMQGKGRVKHLENLLADEMTAAPYRDLRHDGKWRVRDDAFIWYLGRHGALTVGYGTKPNMIGPELGFGWVVADASPNPVLLIKIAWGGKSLAEDFLPPSAGGPGPFYTQTIEHARSVLREMPKLFPKLKGKRPRLAGFVWFQGWNDMINKDRVNAYPDRMAHFIRDVRKDLEAPGLPFVIGELGVEGEEAKGNKKEFRTAQAAAAKLPEFKGNVAFARTAPLYDMAIHQLFLNGVWKGPDKARWENVGGDRPYHYLGSGKIYYAMGRAFGESMIAMSVPKGERSIRIDIDEALLTPKTRAIKRDLEARRTAAAHKAIQKARAGRKDAEVYAVLAGAAQAQLNPILDQLDALHRVRDPFGARRVLQSTRRRFRGMPRYDALEQMIDMWLQQENTKELLKAGRTFYRAYETAARSRSESDRTRLAALAARYPDTVYGRRAAAAAEALRPGTRPLAPERFLSE
ncbi:MAG: sialate O-acetylesterase [Planctomycetota bacterium]|jgi:alpha-galactosidase